MIRNINQILVVLATPFLLFWNLQCIANQSTDAISPVSTNTYVAYSLSRARERIRSAIESGGDFRTDTELYTLGGISRPIAAVIDLANSDIILVGERIAGENLLDVDDFSVALRSAFMHPDDHPGVSIEPRTCKDCDDQDVLYFAGIENTRMGYVSLEADWLLKSMSLGRIPTHFESFFRRSAREWKSSLGPDSRFSVRFWFYPTKNRVSVIDNLVWLDSFRIGVFDEIISMQDSSGQPLAASDYNFESGANYANDYTKAIDLLIEKHPILATLDAMMRLVGVTKGLAQQPNNIDLNYFAYQYTPNPLTTKNTVEMLHTIDRKIGFELSGGVDMASLVLKLGEGDSDAFTDLVTVSRPSATSLTWEFSVTVDNGMPTGIQFQDYSIALDDISKLYNQGWFYMRQRRFGEAVDSFEALLKILDAQSSDAKAEIMRSLSAAIRSLLANEKVSFNKDFNITANQLDRAVEILREAKRADPTNWDIITELGWTYHSFGQYEDAANEFRHAIELEPQHPEAYFWLGMSLESLGSLDQAKENIFNAIEKSLNEPYLNEANEVLERIEFRSTNKLRFSRYTDSSNRFSLSIPENWEIVTPDIENEMHEIAREIQLKPGTVFFIENPSNSNHTLFIQYKLIENGSSTFTGSELLEISHEVHEVIRNKVPGYRKLSQNIANVKGTNVLTYKTVSNVLDIEMMDKVVMFMQNSRYVQIIVSAPSQEFESIDKKIFRPIIDSFQLKF